MAIKRKPAAIFVASSLILWQLIGQPIWNLNIERMAERGNLDVALAEGGVMTTLSWFLNYLPNSFGLGFAAGALLFAYWDSISKWIPFLRPSDPAKHHRSISICLSYIELNTDYIESRNMMYLAVDVLNIGNKMALFRHISGYANIRVVDDKNDEKTMRLAQPYVIDQQFIGPLHRWENRAICIGIPMGSEEAKRLNDYAKNCRQIFLDVSDLSLAFEGDDDEEPDVIKLMNGFHLFKSSGLTPRFGDFNYPNSN